MRLSFIRLFTCVHGVSALYFALVRYITAPWVARRLHSEQPGHNLPSLSILEAHDCICFIRSAAPGVGVYGVVTLAPSTGSRVTTGRSHKPEPWIEQPPFSHYQSASSVVTCLDAERLLLWNLNLCCL